MGHHKRSSLALSATALAVVASIVACAVPSQGAVSLPPTLALPTLQPATLAPAATATVAPTDTAAPTQTPLIITATPFVVPTQTSTPFAVVTVLVPVPVVPQMGIVFSNPKASTDTVYIDGPCAPLSVEFSVDVAPLGTFAHVDLFTGLPWYGSPYVRWDNGEAMKNNPGSNFFWYTISHETINRNDFVTPEPHPYLSPSPQPLYYQFVATDPSGTVVLARSSVYSINYANCP
jgi:hypothetical protein